VVTAGGGGEQDQHGRRQCRAELRIMQRAKNRKSNRALLCQRLHEFVDKCMQFADAGDRR
jgi:hypothetical protein